MNPYENLPTNKGISVLPDSAFKDSSGDKPNDITGVDAAEIAQTSLIFFNTCGLLTSIAWAFQLSGKYAIHQILLGIVIVGFIVCFVVTIHNIGTPKRFSPKNRILWRFLCGFIGGGLFLLVHYWG